jgi:hypothetical protein
MLIFYNMAEGLPVSELPQRMCRTGPPLIKFTNTKKRDRIIDDDDDDDGDEEEEDFEDDSEKKKQTQNLRKRKEVPIPGIPDHIRRDLLQKAKTIHDVQVTAQALALGITKEFAIELFVDNLVKIWQKGHTERQRKFLLEAADKLEELATIKDRVEEFESTVDFENYQNDLVSVAEKVAELKRIKKHAKEEGSEVVFSISKSSHAVRREIERIQKVV